LIKLIASYSSLYLTNIRMTIKDIIDSWKEEIESINIRGYARKIESIDFFQMNQYYTGHPQLTYCYKVNFNFQDSIPPTNPCVEITLESGEIKKNKENWHHELQRRFILKFGTPIETSQYGDIKFQNEICDYMVDQGYRFIIQFYLPGVISKLREDKIEQILNI